MTWRAGVFARHVHTVHVTCWNRTFGSCVVARVTIGPSATCSMLWWDLA